MTVPTTRETADHAELAEAHYIDLFRTIREAGRSDSEKANAASKYLASILLSEIAALRGERDEWRETVRFNERCWSEERGVMIDRFTQAERQRDELRKALEEIADEAPYRSGYCQSDVEYGPALSADEMQAVARQALSNQGGGQ